MEQDKKIRFAVVGCGHIGKRHIEMVRREPGAQIVAICDVLPLELLKLDTGDQSVVPAGALNENRRAGNEPTDDILFFKDLSTLLSANLPIDVISICAIF